MKRNHIILLVIILLGIAVRIIGIDFGLPSLCHNDEPVIVNYALAYGKGDLNPHFFKVPPLLSYLLFFLYGLCFVIGKALGYFQGVSDFGYRYLTDPTLFYLIGRFFVGLFFGSASIYLIYVLAKKAFNARTGLFAALFLALNFMHVRDSHYIYFDIPLVFCIIMFGIVLYNIYEKNKLKDYCLAGFMLGVAISVKYNAFLLLFPALIVSLWNFLRRGDGVFVFFKNNISALFMMAGALFLTNPFMFLDHKFFISTMSKMPFFTPPAGFHLYVSLIGSTGLMMCIFAAVGFILICIQRNFFGVVLGCFALLNFYIVTVSSQMAERYVFPVIPMLLILSAYSVNWIVGRINKGGVRFTAGVILCMLLLFPSFEKIYLIDKLFLASDTRQESYEWIMRNIPTGAVVALDAVGPALPDIPQNRIFIEESLKAFNNPKFDSPDESLSYKVSLIKKNPYYPEKTFKVYYIKKEPSKDRFLGTFPEIYLDIEEYSKKGIEYIVVSSLLSFNIGKLIIPDLDKKAELIKEFSPYEEEKYRLRPEEDTFVPAAAFSIKELRDRRSFGPVIRIYKVKETH